jgi:large subunit ribosomal protein L18
MSTAKLTKQVKKVRRQARVRKVIIGSAQRPRLNVFRSLRGMYAQLIDDAKGVTLLSVHSKTDAKAGDAGERTGKIAIAYKLGKRLAEKAQEKGITTVVFDRAGYKYHGRVKAVAEGARDGGLQF